MIATRCFAGAMWTYRKRDFAPMRIAPHFHVSRAGQQVGVVYESHRVNSTESWIWSTATYPCGQGRAESFDAALIALREAVRSRWPDDFAGKLPMASPDRAGAG